MRHANPSRPVDPEIAEMADEHGRNPEAILAILQSLQARHGNLTHSVIGDVARALDIPAERAYGVATFYSMLNVAPEPDARKIIRVCDGPACWLRGAAQAHLELLAEFGREIIEEREREAKWETKGIERECQTDTSRAVCLDERRSCRDGI